MVQVAYTKEKGIVQKSGSASFTIPTDVVITRPINQTVNGNTISVVDFGDLIHADAGAVANTVDLNGKYIQFSSKGGKFYAWFNIDAGGADPNLEGTPIEVDDVKANVDAIGNIATVLQAKLDANAAFKAEFNVTVQNVKTIEVCSKRMGKAGTAHSGNMSSFADRSGATFSVTTTITHGTGNYLIGGTGVSVVEDASSKADNGSFVVLDDLKTNDNFGVRKIILSKHPANVTIKNKAEGPTPLGVFNAAGDSLHAVWNGTSWQTIHNV